MVRIPCCTATVPVYIDHERWWLVCILVPFHNPLAQLVDSSSFSGGEDGVGDRSFLITYFLYPLSERYLQCRLPSLLLFMN